MAYNNNIKATGYKAKDSMYIAAGVNVGRSALANRPKIIQTTLEINGKINAVLADYKYWGPRQMELTEWLEMNTEDGAETQQGMTLQFSNEQELLWFKLKWGC